MQILLVDRPGFRRDVFSRKLAVSIRCFGRCLLASAQMFTSAEIAIYRDERLVNQTG